MWAGRGAAQKNKATGAIATDPPMSLIRICLSLRSSFPNLLGVPVSRVRFASQRRAGSDGHHRQPALRKPRIALRNAPHRGIALQGTASVSRHIDAESITGGAARKEGTASGGNGFNARFLGSWGKQRVKRMSRLVLAHWVTGAGLATALVLLIPAGVVAAPALSSAAVVKSAAGTALVDV